MHIAWCCLEEVPYCFSRSSVKFQGHTALKIVEFDPDWAFPDCNSSLNSPMAKKWCTKLEISLKRCPIVFQGHPSNFKVTLNSNSNSKYFIHINTIPYLTSRGDWNPDGFICPHNWVNTYNNIPTSVLSWTGVSSWCKGDSVPPNLFILQNIHVT